MTLATLLNDVCTRRPETAALIDGSRRFSYAELDALTNQLAAGWQRQGFQKGDRIAFFMPNCAELAMCYLACFKLGAIAVPLNARYKAPEVVHAVTDAGVSALAVHSSRWPVIEQVDLASIGILHCAVIGLSPSPTGTQDWSSLMDPPVEFGQHPPFKADQPAAILYTSGSTSRPKGVTYTHATLTAGIRIQSAAWQLDQHDIQLVTSSFAHAAALTTQLLPSLALGGTSVLLDSPDPPAMVDAVRMHRCTRLLMLPAVLEDLAEHLEHAPAELSTVRSVIVGGDVVSPSVQALFHQRTGIEVSEVWGMTECLGSLNNPPFGTKHPGSIGLPAPEVEVRLIDENGRDTPDGHEGEMLIRSPAMTIGYWNNPEATAAAIIDGWLYTGDLAKRDTDGCFWFMGRRKEIIVRGGSNISPIEVEEVIAEHPAVMRVGVVGSPHPRLGQIVTAAIMLDPDHPPPSEEELKQFVEERIASYKVPERIHFLSELPLNPVGKVDRHRLLNLLNTDPTATVSEASSTQS